MNPINGLFGALGACKTYVAHRIFCGPSDIFTEITQAIEVMKDVDLDKGENSKYGEGSYQKLQKAEIVLDSRPIHDHGIVFVALFGPSSL